ncbi:HisA/HisF-related TIM barrel protein [Methylocystis sp. S23]|jgi:HisA/HisF family protein
MQVIPVIDIRNGAAMRAVAGRRDEYAPIETPLAATSAPLDVARGLLSLYPFETLYIADLDAIEGRGDNSAAIDQITSALPQLRFWVDAGIKNWEQAPNRARPARVDLVLGSENCRDAPSFPILRDDARIILSLDFMGEQFLGHPSLLEFEAGWPRRLIVMTLARVGANAGPDFARLGAIAARAQGRGVYAAGGVRGGADLLALEKAGAAGALVASALHDGRLTRADLSRLAEK